MSRIVQISSSLYDAALALFYPRGCAVCGASVESRTDGAACADCWQETRVFTGEEVICWKCGALTRGKIRTEERTEVRCHRCDDWAFIAARSCGLYEGALRASVLALKREPHASTRLARLMREAQRRAPLNESTLIIPAPLHKERERERGFNQAAILARALGSLSNLPVDEWSLIRTAHTVRHRAGMDERGRRETVENAFKVVRPRLIEGKKILLVDDVFTTGATVSACASALKASGAQDVFVLTLARATLLQN